MADLKSWNLWHGCNKYSEGCDNCYMYYLDKVRGVPERARIVSKTSDFMKPLKKSRSGEYKIPSGYCLRVNMTSDTFLEEADEWREDMWRMIKSRADIRFYILTKRVPRISDHLPADWGDGYENVDFNISCENQRAFDERWPIFKNIPAKHKGLNLAPLIGGIDIMPALASGQIEQVCLGGEGFGGQRPCRYEWIKQISDACAEYKVNFTVNSIGAVFIKGGRTYYMEKQNVQGKQAYLSGLSHFYRKIPYKLFDPRDGHLLRDSELLIPQYNKERCLTCTSSETCIGCVDCGACKNVELITYEELVRLRSERNNKIWK